MELFCQYIQVATHQLFFQKSPVYSKMFDDGVLDMALSYKYHIIICSSLIGVPSLNCPASKVNLVGFRQISGLPGIQDLSFQYPAHSVLKKSIVYCRTNLHRYHMTNHDFSYFLLNLEHSCTFTSHFHFHCFYQIASRVNMMYSIVCVASMIASYFRIFRNYI